MWGSGSVEVKRKMEAKQNMLENGTVRAREKHTLDLSATPLLRFGPGPKVKQQTHFCLVQNRRSQIRSQTCCLETWPRDLSPPSSSKARCK